jgi:hypothetical protein
VAAYSHPDEVDGRDADDSAQASGAAKEVQGRPRKADAGDDEDVSGGGRQPGRRLPTGAYPDADLYHLWRVFINFEFNEGFLWIPDLGLNDPLFLLPILYIAIMVAQAVVSSKGNRQTLQQQLLISGVFVFFAFTFPAGVTLYLITSMLVQVLQQWLIQRNVGPTAPALATGVTPVPTPSKAKPVTGAKSKPKNAKAK